MEFRLTSIPELIKRHGSLRATTRNTGISNSTLIKHQHDIKCEHHIIVNGQLMFARDTTPKMAPPRNPGKYEFIDNKLVRIE